MGRSHSADPRVSTQKTTEGMAMERLAGKVALVVGGGADGPAAAGEELAIGNGRAAAIQIGREGAAVMIADRSLEAAEATAAEIRSGGGRAAAVACDVVDEAQCADAVAATVRELGGLQLLVNNVGIADMGAVGDVPADEFDRVIAVNVRGHFLTIKHALPEIAKAGGGAIVTVSSLNALRTGGAGVAYDTSKAALIGMTRHVAATAAPMGIRVNTILPGIIDSTMLRRMTSGMSVDLDAMLLPKIPMGRLGSPWDIAKAIVFLLSDDASFVTGTELLVDGGTAAIL